MSLNKVMLIGNVGRDPEVRYLEGNAQAQGNAKVATFTLATTERYRDRNGEMRENTEWHNIVAWRNSADIAERYIRKGTQVYIEGKLRTRQWTDQTGNKRYTTEINVDNLQLLGKRPDSEGAPQGGYQAPATPSYQQSAPSYQAPAAPSYQQSAPSYQAPAAPSFQQNTYPQAPAQQAAPQSTAPAGPLDLGDLASDDLPF